MANGIGDYNYNWANIFPGGEPFRTYGEDTSDLSGMAEVYNRPPLNQTNYPQPNVPFQDFSFSEYQGPSQEEEGITATDAAQKQGWLQNLMDNTMWGKVAAGFDATNPRAFNYNPALQGQIDFMGGNPFGQGSAYGINPTSGLNQITGGTLAGKNLQSMFGTNDLQKMYEDQIGKYEKTYANLDEQWGNTLNEKELAAKKHAYFNKFLNPAKLQHQELLEKLELEEKKKADAAAAAAQAPQPIAPQHHGDVSKGGGHQAPAFRTAPKSWDVSSGMGPGGKHYAYGGRVGYKTGGRVGILSVF